MRHNIGNEYDEDGHVTKEIEFLNGRIEYKLLIKNGKEIGLLDK